MSEQEYRELIEPAIREVIKLFQSNERKHKQGLHLTDDDIKACASHALSAMRGKPNDEEASHTVAAAARAIKAVLLERMNFA